MPLLTKLTDALWAFWLPVLFLLTGLICSIRTGFFQLFGLKTWLRATVGSILRPTRESQRSRGISQVQTLCTALASTIGTGSIAGAATAICAGGPGAVFWMWVCTVLGMMTSFAEKTLSVAYRRPDGRRGWAGGPMFYIRDGVGSRVLSRIFCVFCIGAAFISGNLIQSASIAQALHTVYGFPLPAVGVGTALCTALVLTGGVRRLGRVSSILVPAMGILYVGGGTLILLLHAERLGGILRCILLSAFTPQAIFGAGSGYTVRSAIRYGLSRGIFTNEAGLGSSAIAHAAARVDHPARQGMWGILECGVSTLLVCTVTSLVVLDSGLWLGPSRLTSGSALTVLAFSSTLGAPGGHIVALSELLFAFSSILGWSYYGQQCICFLTGNHRWIPYYKCIFLLVTALSFLWTGYEVWILVDLCSAAMALPNLTALILLSGQARAQLTDFLESGRS